MRLNKTSITELIDKLKTLFERKPILVIAVPVGFLLLLALLIVFVISLGGEPKTASPPPSASSGSVPAAGSAEETPTIEILPETERLQPEKDPFGSSGAAIGSGAMKVTGIITSAEGISTAIISAGGSSCIVSVGSVIGETEWTVTEIDEEGVTLSDGESEKKLLIDPDAKE